MPDWTLIAGGSTTVLATLKGSGLRYTVEAGMKDHASFFIACADAAATAPLTIAQDVEIRYGADVCFQGFVSGVERVFRGGSEAWAVTLAGAGQKLDRCPHTQRVAVGPPPAVGMPPEYAWTSSVLLGFDQNGDRLNLRNTIVDLLADTQSRHGLANGSILTGHDVTAPLMEMKDVTTGEALRRCLAMVPDAVCWYAHAEGLIYISKPASMTTVTTAGSGDGSGVASLHLDSKSRFPVGGVIVNWETTATVDGEPRVTIEPDEAGTVTGLDVPIITIPLRGPAFTTQRMECKTALLPRTPADLTAAQWVEFFEDFVPELKGLEIEPGQFEIGTVKQTVDVDAKVGLGAVPEVLGLPAYPRLLRGGGVPAWQAGISSAPVLLEFTVKPGADVKDNVKLLEKFGRRSGQVLEFKWNGTGTDAQSTTYDQPLQTDGGEEPAMGLAAEWLASLNAPSPAGTVEFAGQEPRLDFSPGQKLTLTGAVAVTGAVIQRVTVDVDAGRTVVQFGPVSPLNPADMVELMRAGSRRSPVVNGSGSPRTSSAATGTIEQTPSGSARAASLAETFQSMEFRCYQTGPSQVMVGEGTLVTLGHDFQERPVGAPWSGVQVFKTVFIDPSEEIEVTDGDVVWAKVDMGVFESPVFRDGGTAYVDGGEYDVATQGNRMHVMVADNVVYNAYVADPEQPEDFFPLDHSEASYRPIAKIKIAGGVMTIRQIQWGAIQFFGLGLVAQAAIIPGPPPD